MTQSSYIPSPSASSLHTLQRVVFPDQQVSEVRPLYISDDGGFSHIDRNSLLIHPGRTVHCDTYFNGFPASYWALHTSVRSVRLEVLLSAPAVITVYGSLPDGSHLQLANVESERYLSQEIPLADFTTGGWLWFSLSNTGTTPLRLLSSRWVTSDAPVSDGDVGIAITTFNRPDDCVAQLRRLSADPEALAVIRSITIVDQGTHHVRDAHGIDEAVKALHGIIFNLVEQDNLGGSGGYSRGMIEAMDTGAEFVLLLDDDASAEPESIRRSLMFSRYTPVPTIVGAHMLNAVAPTRLHSFGETVRMQNFLWQSVVPELDDSDLATIPLSTPSLLHKLIEVGYNGWWMCLIPATVLRDIGLSLPFFIKWDDAEFGLRAREAGFPTVTLPGVAAWHIPWTTKDDGLDWQAYFHVRNRVVTALLHSPEKRGGSLMTDVLLITVLHLVCMQYTVAKLRIQALQDVLKGPEHLFPTLSTRAQETRRVLSAAGTLPTHDPKRFPPAALRQPADIAANRRPTSRPILLWRLFRAVARQLAPVRSHESSPQVWVPSSAGRWWRIGGLDSAAVSTADNTGVFLYTRDRRRFFSLLRRIIGLTMRIRHSWPALASAYRRGNGRETDISAWKSALTRS